MSSPVQIRNVPDEDRRALKARAASRGESLNTYLLGLIARDVARPTAGEVLERAARRTGQGTTSAVAAVHAARDERDEQLARVRRP